MRESMQYDVLIVGAGPAGLACAIRLKQLAEAEGKTLSVCVLEKGAAVGAHLLSGAVLETRALDELLPNWQSMGAPIDTAVTTDDFQYLYNDQKGLKLPTPKLMKNDGNYIVSLSELGRWLATQAEALGVEIFAGFAASEILYHADGAVKGVATGDMGIQKNGEKGDNYTQGVEIHAHQTVFAEGCRGSLSKQLIAQFDLQKDKSPQTYALGVKEIWQVESPHYSAGQMLHTVGWPLKNNTYGGSFVYHMANNKVAIGFVVGLDYQNPTLSPFHELQRFKHHPDILPLLEGGKRLAYGAKTLVEGGVQSMPKLTAPGAVLVGDAAGTLNVAKIKGNHTAMKSGMVAAEALFEHFNAGGTGGEVVAYEVNFKSSWAYKELYQVRNIRPGFKHGLILGALNAFKEMYLWPARRTLKNHADHAQLKPVGKFKPIAYPKPDGEISFDKPSSVYLSNTYHEENQPAHLKLKDEAAAIDVNLNQFGAPETHYCPAGVYEILKTEDGLPFLQINAQNCLHCKACDIKDPTQNINWQTPEGGGGPNYTDM